MDDETVLVEGFLDIPAEVAAVTVAVDPGLIKACGQGTGEYYFNFDSAKLDDASTAHLQSVADCLNATELADDDVVLVGHASPPGTDTYNQALGMSRAQRVRDFLVSRGVSTDRISVQSAGEVSQTEADATGAPMGRRVDLRILEEDLIVTEYLPIPAIKEELILTRPSDAEVWVPGYWERDAEDWVWETGRWDTPPHKAAHWEPGQWKRVGEEWHWHRGRWEAGEETWMVDAPLALPDLLREKRPPKPGDFNHWVAGHWDWVGSWLWVPGDWTNKPHPKATWVDGQWLKVLPDSWWWMGGHWEVES